MAIVLCNKKADFKNVVSPKICSHTDYSEKILIKGGAVELNQRILTSSINLEYYLNTVLCVLTKTFK